MATLATGQPAGSFSSDQPFFVKLAWILSAVIVFGFAQNAALGRIDIPAVPIWVHLHGVAMLAWLGLFIAQNRLAASGNFRLHRKLGWLGAFLVCFLFGLTCFTAVMAVAMHRAPPFFPDGYFLAMTITDALAFAGLVFAGISNRADTQTHRRLMMGATIVAMDPALGRLLPMPLLGTAGEWLSMVIQLGVVAVMALHDRKTLGRVHAATASAGLVIALQHVVTALAGQSEPVIALAARIAMP